MNREMKRRFHEQTANEQQLFMRVTQIHEHKQKIRFSHFLTVQTAEYSLSELLQNAVNLLCDRLQTKFELGLIKTHK